MNPERLLGSLLGGALGRRRLPAQATMAIGMGAVGLAMAAWEHFSQQRQAASPPTAPPPLPPALPSQPLPTGTGDLRPSSSPGGPPPLPGAADVPVAMAHTEPVGRAQREALLLLRAMVAAAWADGCVDPEEQAAIQDRLATAGLGAEEKAFLARELAAPPRLETLLGQVDSPQLAEQVYLVSALATRADTPMEQEYLRRLALQLRLEPGSVQRLHLLVGLPT